MPDTYTAIWQVRCQVCDASPVVGIWTPEGQLTSSGFCGSHFFGDRYMMSPENWNTAMEATE